MFNRVLMGAGLALALMVTSCAHSDACKCKHAKAAQLAGQEEIMVQPAMDLSKLKEKLDRYAPVRLGFDSKALDEDQVQAVEDLVAAAKILDDLFWEQATEFGPTLRARLEKSKDDTERILARYLAINYGAYDRLDGFEPFIKASTKDDKNLVPPDPLGATFYPVDMSKEDFSAQLKAHPEDTEAFQSNFTVIVRKDGKLEAKPYSSIYKDKLDKAASLLKKAAREVHNESLSKFLNSRADAFSSNDYFQSDMDWMDVKDSPLDVTIGPYEVYEDRLFNYKASFEAFITLKDKASSEKLEKVGQYLTDMEKNLPIPDEHKNFHRGSSSPIVVVDLIYSAGDTRAGVQTLAFNLPNDERVREKKGSKKVLLKNVSHAKFDSILTPIAKKVLAEDQLDKLSFDAYFNHTLMHEVSHGLGPGFIEKEGKRVTVNVTLKDLYSTIEEAKADVLGMYNTLYLVDKGVLPKELSQTALVSFLAGIFRSVRFGVHEAHGRANLLAFNYLLQGGAYKYDADKKRFSVDLEKAPEVVKALAHDLLMVEALGDYQGAKELIEKYGKVGPEMQSRLDDLGDVPVDIVPEFEVEP